MGAARAMSELDYFGPDGGRLAMAFGTGWAACFAIMIALGGFVWRFFGKARIEQLEKDRAADNAKCAADLQRERERINDLELLLFMHGPGELRAAMQGAMSEQSLIQRGMLDPGGTKPVEGR